MGPTWRARDIMQPRQPSLMQNKRDVSAGGCNINCGPWPMKLSETPRRGWGLGGGLTSFGDDLFDF